MSLDTLVEAARYLESSSKGTSRDDTAIARVHNSAAVQTERRRAFSESEPLERRRRPGGAGTRETHNKLEKNRRAHLKECFDVLKREVPSLEDKKTSNLNILRSALKYIQTLKKRERDYEAERDVLTSSNISFRQRLHVLRREIIVRQENSNNGLKDSVEKTPADDCHQSTKTAAIKVRSVETQVSPVSVATQTTFSSAEEWKAGGAGASNEVEGVQVEAVGVPPSVNLDSGHEVEKKVEETICVDDDEDEEVDVEGEVTDNNLEVDESPVGGEGTEGKASDLWSAVGEMTNHVKGDSNVEHSPSSQTPALKRKAPRHNDGSKLETKKSNIQCCARVSS